MKKFLAFATLVLLSSCGPMTPAFADCISIEQAQAFQKQNKVRYSEIRDKTAMKIWLDVAERAGAEIPTSFDFVVVAFFGDQAFVMYVKGMELCDLVTIPKDIANRLLRRA